MTEKRLTTKSGRKLVTDDWSRFLGADVKPPLSLYRDFGDFALGLYLERTGDGAAYTPVEYLVVFADPVDSDISPFESLCYARDLQYTTMRSHVAGTWQPYFESVQRAFREPRFSYVVELVKMGLTNFGSKDSPDFYLSNWRDILSLVSLARLRGEEAYAEQVWEAFSSGAAARAAELDATYPVSAEVARTLGSRASLEQLRDARRAEAGLDGGALVPLVEDAKFADIGLV